MGGNRESSPTQWPPSTESIGNTFTLMTVTVQYGTGQMGPRRTAGGHGDDSSAVKGSWNYQTVIIFVCIASNLALMWYLAGVIHTHDVETHSLHEKIRALEDRVLTHCTSPSTALLRKTSHDDEPPAVEHSRKDSEGREGSRRKSVDPPVECEPPARPDPPPAPVVVKPVKSSTDEPEPLAEEYLKLQQPLEYICPFKFPGSQAGYWHFHTGWQRYPCPFEKPLKDVLTVISTTSSKFDGERFRKDLQYVYKDNMPTLESRKLDSVSDAPKVYNEMLNQVKTPFFLLIPPASNYRADNDTDVWRLLDTLSQYNVDIVGGSVVKAFKDEVFIRNLARNGKDMVAGDGPVDTPCYQSSLKWHTLRYAHTYDDSVGQCKLCDVISAAFAGKTKEVKGLRSEVFDPAMGSAFIDEFFFHVKSKGRVMASCPDVVFYFNDPVPTVAKLAPGGEWYDDETPTSSRFRGEIDLSKTKATELEKFGNKETFHQLVTPGGQIVEVVACEKNKCKNCRRSKALAMSPCCLRGLADAVISIDRIAKETGVFLELTDGTLMGANKFHHILPYDLDADIAVLSANFTVVSQKWPPLLEKVGLKLRPSKGATWNDDLKAWAGGYATVNCGEIDIELFGMHQVDALDMTVAGLRPTTIEFGGSRVNVPRNPSECSRNRYGKDIFRHALHWKTTGNKNSWQEYVPGFPKCDNPSHSSCLQHEKPDGMVQFDGLFATADNMHGSIEEMSFHSCSKDSLA